MATCITKIHYNDIGTIFRITLVDCGEPVDISLASIKTILFSDPDGDVVAQTAEFTTDGSDGKIEYVTVDEDLNSIGTWKIQGKVVTPSGSWSSDIGKFKVYSNLE